MRQDIAMNAGRDGKADMMIEIEENVVTFE